MIASLKLCSKKSNYEFMFTYLLQSIPQSVCEIIARLDNIIWSFISLSNEHGVNCNRSLPISVGIPKTPWDFGQLVNSLR